MEMKCKVKLSFFTKRKREEENNEKKRIIENVEYKMNLTGKPGRFIFIEV